LAVGVHREGRVARDRRRLTMSPIFTEFAMKWSIFNGPAILTPRTQCKPLLAAQPHCEQSGVPPKTHGSTRV
jgi:hypothetical protein